MDVFDKMLKDYSEGEGSAFIEAQKSATNLEGSLNSLKNSWTELVNTFISADGLTDAVNMLNNFLQGVTDVTSALGSLGTIGVIGGGILGAKNAGICV